MKLSQETFAVDAGIDRAYVSRLERRAVGPSVDILDRLAKALEVDVVELLREPSARSKAPTLKAGRKPGKAR